MGESEKTHMLRFFVWIVNFQIILKLRNSFAKVTDPTNYARRTKNSLQLSFLRSKVTGRRCLVSRGLLISKKTPQIPLLIYFPFGLSQQERMVRTS